MEKQGNQLTIEEAIVILTGTFTDINPEIFWKEIRKKYGFNQPSELTEEKTREVIRYLDDRGIQLLSFF